MSDMRVVHLISVHPPFDTRIFHKECRSLVQAGYAVTLVAPHDRDECVDGVQIVAIPKASRRLQRISATTVQVYRKALQLDADLYHFHDSELIPAALLLQVRGKKVIYDIHEDLPRAMLSKTYLTSYARRPMSWFVERVENFGARRFSALVAATPAIGARFQVLNPRTVVVNNYPPCDELAPPTQGTWQGRNQAVAYIGAISLKRGIVEMVKAMGSLPETLGAVLELAGAFSPLEHRDRVQTMRGWACINERGILGRAEVARLLSRVRAGLVLFHPEPNHVEAQPNKLFEYMSAGIPVLASDFPSWREIIERGGCGLLVDPLDPRAIAEAIEWLLTHPAEAEAMGRRGREAVEKRYNWASEETKLLQLYADLLGPAHAKSQVGGE